MIKPKIMSMKHNDEVYHYTLKGDDEDIVSSLDSFLDEMNVKRELEDFTLSEYDESGVGVINFMYLLSNKLDLYLMKGDGCFNLVIKTKAIPEEINSKLKHFFEFF